MKRLLVPLALAATVALPTVAQASTSFREVATTTFTASSSTTGLAFNWTDALSSRFSPHFGSVLVESDGDYKLRIIDNSTGHAIFKDNSYFVGDVPGVLSGVFADSFGGLSSGTSYTVKFIGHWIAPGHPNWSTLVAPSVSVSAVPEPETYAMFLAGLGIIGVIARRRRST